MTFGKWHRDYRVEKCVKNTIRRNGCLLIPKVSRDYDKDDNFLKSEFVKCHREAFDIAKRFVEIYNPHRLSVEKYREKYPEGR